jgi:hypothetical protein
MPLKIGTHELVMIMAFEAAPESSNKTAQLKLLITTVRLARAWCTTFYTISRNFKIAAAQPCTISHGHRHSAMNPARPGSGGRCAGRDA